MNISLKKITIENFKSVSEKQELELPRNGLILLEAQPYNGSSSGVGKSSVLAAFDYVFTGSYTGSHTHWYAMPNDKSKVSMFFRKETDDVVVEKSPGETTLTINSIKTPGGVKVVMAAIEDFLKIDTRLIVNLTHKRQRQRDEASFLKSNDGEKKEFLSKVLGLDEIESLLKAAAKKADEYDILIQKDKTIIEGLKQELSELKEILPFNEKELIETESLFAIKKAEWGNYQANKDKKRAELTGYLEKLKIEQDKIENTAKENFKKINNNFKSKLTDKLNELKLQKNKREIELKEEQIKKEKQIKYWEIQKNNFIEVEKLRKEINHVQSGFCPFCKREWKTQDALDIIKNNEQKILSKNLDPELNLETINNAFLEEKKVNSIDATLLSILDKISKIEEKIKNEIELQKNEILTQKNLELEELQKRSNFSELSFEIEFMEKRERELNAGVVILYDKISQLKTEKAKNINDIANFNSNKKKIEAKLQAQVDELNQLEINSALEKDFRFALGGKGFLGAVIEEILQEISDEINGFMATIPNISGLSVRIRNLQENNNSIKPKINYQIFKENFRVDVNDLSEGQRSSLDFVTFLAVREVVFKRLNVRLNYILLDESLDYLTFADKKACFDILNTLAQENIIIVVDHNDQFKSLFENRVNVTYDGRSTSIGKITTLG